MGSGSLAEVIVVLLAVSCALAWNAESFQENWSSGDEHFPAPNGDKVANAADARVSDCTLKNPFRDSIEGSQDVFSQSLFIFVCAYVSRFYCVYLLFTLIMMTAF